MAQKQDWIATEIEVEALGWAGNPIHLTGVPAMRHAKTGEVLVHPSEVAKAESRMVAKQYGIEGRDIPLLLILHSPAGIFSGGEVFYKYHINKMLFYEWKDLGKVGLEEGLDHDEFEAADRGPVPKHIDEDLNRLVQEGIIETRYKQWGSGERSKSLGIFLTEKGKELAEKLWFQVPSPVQEVTLRVKEHLHLKVPAEITKRVHEDYPQYAKKYTKDDTD